MDRAHPSPQKEEGAEGEGHCTNHGGFPGLLFIYVGHAKSGPITEARECDAIAVLIL
jgi:hypothetical protein